MPKFISIIGHSGSGKTRLISRLIKRLRLLGYTVGTIKHAHVDFELDKKGKDSYKHFNAGAHITLVMSPKKYAVFGRSNPVNFNRFFNKCDIVLAEGLRSKNFPKIEVFDEKISKSLLSAKEGIKIEALITDKRPANFSRITFKRRDHAAIVKFIVTRCLT